jgi:transcriptional regulator GlxA family with amidase domain
MKQPSAKRRESGIRKVTILAFEGTLEMSVALSRDLFVAAGMGARYPTEPRGRVVQTVVEVATLDGAPVRSFSGATLHADRAINEIANTDLIMISGIWGDVEPFVNMHRAVITWLEQQHGRGALIGCLSTGTFLLAETGLLEGRPATIYWRMVEPFRGVGA